MTIILEGPDGGGKTRLVLRLQERFQCEVAPRVVEKDTTSKIDLKKWVEEDVIKWPHKMIYDRHRLISEPIYGPLIRGYLTDGFDDPAWFRLNLSRYLYVANGPIVIYCMPPEHEVINNLDGDTDNRAVVNYGRTLYWLYHAQRAMASATLNPPITWDYTKHYNQFDALVDEICRQARRKWGTNVRY